MRYLLLLLCLLTACQSQPDLIGHWHVETYYPDSDGMPHEEHYTFDVLNDTMASMWSHEPFWNGSPCHFDKEAKRFYWNTGCLSFDWGYEVISENELAITDNHSGATEQIKLLRKTDCTIETHLFMNSRLDVTLPESNATGINLDDQASLLRHYTIGPATEEYQAYYPEVFHYQLGDNVVEPDDTASLALFELQHRVKLPEAKRHLSKSVIFANAETPANSLDKLLSYTCGHNNETLYFATLQRSPDTTILNYQSVVVRSATAPADLSVAEWLYLQQEIH